MYKTETIDNLPLQMSLLNKLFFFKKRNRPEVFNTIHFCIPHLPLPSSNVAISFKLHTVMNLFEFITLCTKSSLLGEKLMLKSE